MRELEIELPNGNDGSTLARVKRLHFYSVREEFLQIWKQHEQFLMEYEDRVKRALQRQAKIGNIDIQSEIKGVSFNKISFFTRS